MRPTRKQCSLFVLAALSFASAQAATLLVNANGYTLNSQGDLVQFTALAFDDHGKILAVGKDDQLKAQLAQAKQIDVHGKTVLPGLIDAHGHVFGLGQMLGQLDLGPARSLDAALKAIRDYAAANAGQGWLFGRGWNQENWQLGRFPNALELDSVVADRPVWLTRVDGHAGWANSRALALAGITDATPDPAGGKIVRDAAGRATGVLVDAAQDLMHKVLPQQSEAEARLALERALAEMARVGLTGTHDAGIGVQEDRVYRAYADAGKLTARIYAMIAGSDEAFDILSRSGPLKNYADGRYALRAVKLFSDGALGSRGAALMAPYSDEPHSHGLLFYKQAQMDAMMTKAMARGYQVNVHAIGDAGNRQILDVYQKELAVTGSAAQRHRIEHAQVVALTDIPRFKQLGIVPSMQPTHATSDKNMAESRVGLDRIKGAYAWRSFLQQGSRIACGSDFPVEAPNPFYGIHAAVTRQDASGQPLQGWHPEQAMTRIEALRCFTLDAAYAGHADTTQGSLEPGKWADFIIVDRDLMTIPAADIHQTTVLQTWVGGQPVYQKAP